MSFLKATEQTSKMNAVKISEKNGKEKKLKKRDVLKLKRKRKKLREKKLNEI